MKLIPLLALLLLVQPLTGNPLHAQPTSRTIGVPPTCPRCQATLTPTVSMGDSEGPGALTGEPRFLLRLPDGRLLTAEYPVATRVLVYGVDGRFHQVIGSRGQGPGEYEFITSAYVGRDGLVRIVDSGLRRETVLTAAMEVTAISPLPELFVHAARPASNGSVFFNADRQTREGMGLPIHAVSGGHVIRSFGATERMHRPDAPWLGQRALVLDSAGLWLSRRTQYVLERWSTEGQLLATLDRNAAWFRPYLMREQITRDKPPRPWVTDMIRSGDGDMLVLIAVPAADFPRRLSVRNERTDRPTYDLEDCGDFTDTIIESIDLRTARLNWSTRLSTCLQGFVDAETVYRYRLDGNGIPRIELLRVTPQRG